MGRAENINQIRQALTAQKTCWREVLNGAFAGLFGPDHQLEQILDYLECKR